MKTAKPMKTMMTGTILAGAAALVLGLPGQALADERVEVDVNGLVCDFCAVALERTFGEAETVRDITVDLDTKIVAINFTDGGRMSDAMIREMVLDAGYDVVAIRDVAAPGDAGETGTDG